MPLTLSGCKWGLTEPQQALITLIENLGSGEKEKTVEAINIIDTTSNPKEAQLFKQILLEEMKEFPEKDFENHKFKTITLCIAENPSKPQNDAVSSQYLTTSDQKKLRTLEIDLTKVNDEWKIDYKNFMNVLSLITNDQKELSQITIQPDSEVDWKDIDVKIKN